MDSLNSQCDLKLHFLQIITPGQIYPQRSTAAKSDDKQGGEEVSCPIRKDTDPREESTGSLSSLPSGGHKKKFNVEDFGLSWDNIETMHFFIFQGML